VTRKRYDVVPDGDNWKVQSEGRTVRRFGNMEPAVQDAAARGRAAEERGEKAQVVIRRKDGTIQDERTYGDDPHPPRG
jgi:hypothetical protein